MKVQIGRRWSNPFRPVLTRSTSGTYALGATPASVTVRCILTHPKTIRQTSESVDLHMSPKEARELAASIIAMADTVEGKAGKVKFMVNWDNGNHACGTLPQVYDTREEADQAGKNWELAMLSHAPLTSEDGGCFYEVIEVEG